MFGVGCTASGVGSFRMVHLIQGNAFGCKRLLGFAREVAQAGAHTSNVIARGSGGWPPGGLCF
jgi:hypothetical protein